MQNGTNEQLMYRRAWKGYSLRLNPDAHFSRVMYRLLDTVQTRTEGCVYFGRDDQAGFRLNSTYTHKQYESIGRKKSVTTRTDFVKSTSFSISSGLLVSVGL